MTKPTIRIHNTETDEVIDREMTEAELKQHNTDKENYAKIKAESIKAETEKAALLAKIGLTADEAKILLQ
jgi:hypothetical protein